MTPLNGKTVITADVDNTGSVITLPTEVDGLFFYAELSAVRLHWGDSTVAVGDIAATDPVIPPGVWIPIDRLPSTHVAAETLEAGITTDLTIVGFAGRV